MVNSDHYHSAAHCKYLIQYHIVWCPKFRFSVLGGNVGQSLKTVLQNICERYKYKVKALEVMPDYIHIFIDVPQTVAACDAARVLKSVSAVEMFKLFPELRNFYARYGSLWSGGYFISSVGHISEDTVTRYIEEQRNGCKEK
mgnify:CR=1 FL=1